MTAIELCRAAALGGRLERCDRKSGGGVGLTSRGTGCGNKSNFQSKGCSGRTGLGAADDPAVDLLPIGALPEPCMTWSLSGRLLRLSVSFCNHRNLTRAYCSSSSGGTIWSMWTPLIRAACSNADKMMKLDNERLDLRAASTKINFVTGLG
jgi:hypothetical protein